MKIIIEANDKGRVDGFKVEDGKCSLDMLIAIFFGVLEGATNQVLEKASDEDMAYLYEHYNAVFDLFLRNLFPEPPEGYFDLSDAALMFAQDKLIEDIDKKGITFEEALADYEKRAKDYLNKRREGLA